MDPSTSASNNVYSIQVTSGCIHFSCKKKNPDQKNLAYHTLTTIRSNLDRNPRYISLKKDDRDISKIVNDIFTRYEKSYNASFWQKVEDFFTCCWREQTKLEEIQEIRDEIIFKLQNVKKPKEKTTTLINESLKSPINETENPVVKLVIESEKTNLEPESWSSTESDIKHSQFSSSSKIASENITHLKFQNLPPNWNLAPTWLTDLVKDREIPLIRNYGDSSLSSLRPHIHNPLTLLNSFYPEDWKMAALILKLKIEYVPMDPVQNDAAIIEDYKKEMLELAFANSSKPFSLLASVNFTQEDIFVEDQDIAHENKMISGYRILEGNSFTGLQKEPLSEEQIQAFSVENQDQLPIDQRRNLNWILYRLLSNQSVEVRDWKISLFHFFETPAKGYWKISLDQ